MFCESYREVLSEAALRGEGLPHAAEAHIAACADCRETWAEERALAGMIDGGLREIANPDVPASVFAGVRARVVQGEPTRAWTARGMTWPKWSYGAAVLTAVIAVSLLAVGKREVRKGGGATIVAVSPKIGTDESVLREEPVVVAQGTPTKAVTKKRENRGAEGVGSRGQEVLVNGEDSAGLEQFLVRLRNQRISETTAAALVAVNNEPVFEIKPLEIEEMGWPQLAIEPLDSGGSK